MKWTTGADLRAQVIKLWERGELLSSIVKGTPVFPKRLKLKKPTSREISDCYDDIRSWIGEIREIPYCRLEMREFKHQIFGKNFTPHEIWIDKLEDALAFIGKRRETSRFEKLLEFTKQHEPGLLGWLESKPLRALELYDDWERLLSILSWLKERPRPGIYLRQVDAAGVDTKFIELHRGVLSELLDLTLPPESIDRSANGIGQFARRYGFKEKPLRIRFRILDQHKSIIQTNCEQDITLDGGSFARLNPDISHVFITENEINFLSFEALERSMVVFGGGYGIDELARAQWLMNCQIHYWGDIDTHGFAILSAAKNYFPHIQSLLMDEQTLLNYKELWGFEGSQHPSAELPNLHAEEQKIYRGLKQQAWGRNIRLEQERISWSYAWGIITQALSQ